MQEQLSTTAWMQEVEQCRSNCREAKNCLVPILRLRGGRPCELAALVKNRSYDFFEPWCYARGSQPLSFPSNKKGPAFGGAFSIWRRERDSNPRWAFDPYSLSRGAPSATRPPLRILF